MKFSSVKTISYRYGDEEKILPLLYTSNEPFLIKIEDFTDKFSLDYFAKQLKRSTYYSSFSTGHEQPFIWEDFPKIISEIKNEKPYRIFGEILPQWLSSEIHRYIPLWQKIPLRPRYFNKLFKTVYFFGGVGAQTHMHFDREHCCNLHLCLCGKKQLLLFTQDQSDLLYKVPFVGDCLVNFSEDTTAMEKNFSRLKKAQGYKVILERGDMLFMPRNCWHFTEYLAASASATYAFYPHKFWQYYGYFTGNFYFGYKLRPFCGINQWRLIQKFNRNYARACGLKKLLYKTIEFCIFPFILLFCAAGFKIQQKIKPRRIL